MDGSPIQQSELLAAVADGVRAPSSHNTQPWLFALVGDSVELYADRTRALPVNDPADRELIMSCGAALTNIVLSARHRGWTATVERFPSDDPDHLATVRLRETEVVATAAGGTGGPVSLAEDDEALWAAISGRRTARKPFREEPVSPEGVAALRAAVTSHREDGVALTIVDGERRAEVAALVAKADELQFDDRRWRRELAAWMHPRRTGDGLVVPAVAGAVTRMVVSTVDLGDRMARNDGSRLASAPAVMVLSTSTDEEAAWLAAGEALQRVLLTATSLGLGVGFANQPCQVDDTRQLLADLVDAGHPQAVMKVGVAAGESAPTPRRPIEDVLTRIVPNA